MNAREEGEGDEEEEDKEKREEEARRKRRLTSDSEGPAPPFLLLSRLSSPSSDQGTGRGRNGRWMSQPVNVAAVPGPGA